MKAFFFATALLLTIAPQARASFICAISQPSSPSSGDYAQNIFVGELAERSLIAVDVKNGKVTPIAVNSARAYESLKPFDGEAVVSLSATDNSGRISIVVQKLDLSRVGDALELEGQASGLTTPSIPLALVVPLEHIAVACFPKK
jgi:hypothetical protein